MAKKEFEVAFKLGAELESTFTRSMSKASEDFKSLKKLMGELSQSRGPSDYTRPLREDIRKTKHSTRRWLGETKQSMSSWRATVGRMVGVAGAGAFAYKSLKKSMDFEEQMSSIQAVSGLTKDKMSEMQKLALDLGAKTKYSALEAAQGMEELIKAGMNTDKIRNGGLESALNLAAAGGLGLADSAEIMSTAMNAFKKDGMTASQAADVLAGAANASATGVMELKESLAQASAVASGVGMTFTDANVALGVFANNGLKGSDAGTSLKTMLLNLTPQTKSAQREFERLNLMTFHSTKALQFLESKGIQPVAKSTKGIQKTLLEYAAQTVKAKVGTEKADKAFQNIAYHCGAMSSAFYDNKGELKDIGEMAGILRHALKDLNDEQRQVAMKTMFGTDAIRAANILYREGAEGVKNFHAEMSKVTALDVAKQKMDNAKGAIEQFQGALETLQIAALTPLMPKIKQLALQAADASEKFGKWMNTKQAKEWGETLLWVGKAGASMYAIAKLGRFASGTVRVTKSISHLVTTSGFLSRVGRLFAAMPGPIGLAAAAVGTLSVGWMVYRHQQEQARQELYKVKDTLDKAFSDYRAVDDRIQKTTQLTKEYDRLKAKITESKAPVDELREARRKLKEVEQQLIDLHPNILSAEDAKTGKIKERLQDVKKISELEREINRKELESKFLAEKAKLPALGEEQDRVGTKKSQLETSQEEKRKQYIQLLDYSNREANIKLNPDLTELEKKEQIQYLYEEAQKKQVQEDKKAWLLPLSPDPGVTLLGFPRQSSGMTIAEKRDQLKEEISNGGNKLNQIKEDVRKIDESKKAIYDKGIEWIKTRITGDSHYDMDKHAKEFNKLPKEGKKEFVEVIKAVAQLNGEMKRFPTEIKIDIKPMLNTSGLEQTDWAQNLLIETDWRKRIAKVMSQPLQTFASANMPKPYAEGGLITRPHVGLVGEAGPEAIIPLSASRRQRAMSLYEDVGRVLGFPSRAYVPNNFAKQWLMSRYYTGVESDIRKKPKKEYDIFRVNECRKPYSGGSSHGVGEGLHPADKNRKKPAHKEQNIFKRVNAFHDQYGGWIGNVAGGIDKFSSMYGDVTQSAKKPNLYSSKQENKSKLFPSKPENWRKVPGFISNIVTAADIYKAPKEEQLKTAVTLLGGAKIGEVAGKKIGAELGAIKNLKFVNMNYPKISPTIAPTIVGVGGGAILALFAEKGAEKVIGDIYDNIKDANWKMPSPFHSDGRHALFPWIKKFNHEEYANGGFINQPHLGLVGEAGPEAIIPLSTSRRQRALSLYEQVGQSLGVQPYAKGGITGQFAKSDSPTVLERLMNFNSHTEAQPLMSPCQITINSNPSIVIEGNADAQTVQQVNQALQDTTVNLKHSFERMLNDYYQQRRRVSMDGAL